MMAKWVLLGLCPLAVFSAAVPVKSESRGFPPGFGGLTNNGAYDQFPLSFNFSDSQYASWTQIDGSFWANSFVHGSNGHDYHICVHVQEYASFIPGALPSYRAAILDITDPSIYRQVLKIGTEDEVGSFFDENGNFYAATDGVGMEASNIERPLEGVHMWATLEDVEFDLTWNFSSPAILNAALGSYWVSGALGWEWSLPKGATSGSFTISGETIEVVPEKSSTWYDRQWGSLQGDFQWIAMLFEPSDWLDIEVLVNWDWKDSVNGPKEFATLRSWKTGRDSVVPITMTASSTNITAAPSGLEYPVELTVVIHDMPDVEILVTTPNRNQIFEADDAEAPFPAQFSGFVQLVATKSRCPHCPPVKGYGAVDFINL